MSLKFKYVLFIGVLHSVLILLIYFLLQDRKWIFLLSEVLVLFSLFLSYLLYSSFIRPIALLQSGTDAIADADFSVKYLKTGSNEIDKLVSVFNQMIDQLRKERVSVTEQSYFTQKLIEVSNTGIIIMDFDGLISNINPAALKILKIDSNWRGKQLTDFSNPLIDAITSKTNNENSVISISGVDKYKYQSYDVIHQGFKRKFFMIDDLSKEMLQSEKEAFGKIIRMMAHEVNNSMGAINSILDTVMEYGLQDDEDVELKESLVIAKERNLSLRDFMGNYASILRLPPPQKTKVNLNDLLQKSGKLFRPIAKEKDISIEFDMPLHPVYLDADPILLEQAVSNILKNSIEAIDRNGDILIKCLPYPLQFIISDNGDGIPPNKEQKIFTPFFSTKPTGQGVGLMLVRDILLSHQANFSLKTDYESGWTHFVITF